MKDRMENIEFFRSKMKSVKRDGIDELMKFIEKSDFYTAPASTRFHGAYEGGLLEHSINVYHCLMEKKQQPAGTIWGDALAEISEESIIIVSLLQLFL